MHPTLLDLNFLCLAIHISSYRFFLLLAIAVVIAGSYAVIKRSDLDLKKSMIVLGVAIVAFLIGARLLNILINLGLYIEYPARIYSLSATGFSEYGGIIGGAIAGLLVARRMKLDIWRLGDLLAPNLGIGIAVMRVGCYLNGCCFGTETKLPWGVKFPIFSDAHLHQLSEGTTSILSVQPVHPTEIYELIAALIGTAIAMVILKKKMNPGVAILAFAIWFTTFRFLNHFIRVMPNSFDAPYLFYPLFYLIIIAISSALLYRRLQTSRSS
ncbi:MAG: prolipoprotein diacylglyceryl transferase [Patescibacteria group bacterium]|nr:prolipoprotein diacylglyceryl transferase [Patescibacteria group bacterium]